MSKTFTQAKKSFSLSTICYERIPLLRWLPKYKKSDIVADFIAGLTVGMTLMPQAIAYASLAGLPAQYGLYTAFVGSFTYVIFGTIKEVSIGPTSLMALLTLSYVEGLPIDFVILLTFLVGCVEFTIGIWKLGFLVDFISPCVTSGFTSAMAITVVASQLKNIFGLKGLSNHGVFDVLRKVGERFNEIKLSDTLLGVSCMIVLFAFKQLPRIKTRNPFIKKTLWLLSISRNALVVFTTSIIAFCLCNHGESCTFLLSGDVPSGLPRVKIPSFSTQVANQTVNVIEMVQMLGSGIIVIPVAAVLANVAIAKTFAAGAIVDATQEMITLGLCNMFGAFVQAMPSTGAFTRSAVASSSGVRTPLQGFYSGTIILLALSFLTPYFYFIPRATLGAVLISAIITMFDYEIFPKLWRCNKFDFCLTITTLAVGVICGVEVGILAGGILNLIILLKIWVRPEIEVGIKIDDGSDYIYVKPELGLYYSATDYLTTKVIEASSLSDSSIMLDCSNIVRVDYAACETIRNLIKTYNVDGRKLFLQNVRPEVYRVLKGVIAKDYLPMSSKSNTNQSDKTQEAAAVPLIIDNVDQRKMSYYDNV